MKRNLLLLICLVGLAQVSFAQSNCTQKISEAEDLYEAGRLYEVTKKLNEGTCLTSKEGFSKEEKIRAYRLLALVYLFMDNEPDAEDAVVHLLQVDPEHPDNDPNDPAELRILFSKYRSKPIFRLGGFLGMNMSSVSSLQSYGGFNQANNGFDFDPTGSQVSKEFGTAFGTQFGLTLEYMIIKNLEIILRGQFVTNNYELEYQLISNGLDNDPEIEYNTGSFEVSLSESQSWIKVPLLLRYNIPLGNYVPYVTAGGSYDFLVASSMTGSRSGLGTKFVTGLDLTQYDMRNTTNWSLYGGIGLKYTVKRTNSLFIEAGYYMGGANFVDGENRYASDDFNWSIGHVDDDKVLNSIAVSVGFIHSFYNPKKYSDSKLEKLKRKKQRND
ncbi:hypothetical protein [Reichenbachiella ulvae]|uniref:Outer membrane protein beta-barrel domain-containing protein n=1 Tax=Reichenbachiella ulvae TaxID=2980104 RepID=A0ABT3CSS0_9BACT|nr:hypothetical protein [Reichenbachiella ulvae]MCV9386554.1 hypothetical protein [Reichenbachiella ulvae]